MTYENMSWIRKLFHEHTWALPFNDEYLHCEECGYEPRCNKHGKTLYMHGWDNNIDCLECQMEYMKLECKYCGFNYQDPTYCSVSGRTADKHEWI